MIESLKTRMAIVIASIAAAVIWNVPNITTVSENWWFSKSKIIYGLDIQGGLHLVLGVDVNGVIKEKTERMAANLKVELAEKNIAIGGIQIVGENSSEIEVALGSATVEDVEKYIEDFYPSTLQILDSAADKINLKIFDSQISTYKKQIIDQSIEVIRNRIDEFGVSEPSISAQGDNRILVQLPGIEDSARAKELINKTARLDFRALSKKSTQEEVNAWVLEAEEKGGFALGKDGLAYSAYVKQINESLKGKLPEKTKVVFEKAPSATSLEAGKIAHLVDLDSDLNGGHLEDASVRPDEMGRPEVIFRFNPDGRRRFADLTEKIAEGYLAIVLDDVVKSAPRVKERIDSQTARIEMGGTRDYQETMSEAQLIATALRAGALPAALEQLEERTVGPTLGADSIEKGKTAGFVGAILVLAFMLIYYRGLGVIADVALSINILMLLAILTSLGATLTLPGVAGIVLTMGMAVDANVIIFERIKEELVKGASFKAAVKDGFGHALSAILDSNITTAAVCIVLMYFGTGPVRGFAVTLLVGIVTSVFTATFVSQTLIELLTTKFGVKKMIKI